MKMQKAEMEVVTFGAQDVIATSGPGNDFSWFRVTGTGKWNGFVDTEGDNTFTNGEKTIYLYDTQNTSVESHIGTYYKITPDGYGQAYSSNCLLYGVEVIDGPGLENNELVNFAAIVKWIETHGTVQ